MYLLIIGAVFALAGLYAFGMGARFGWREVRFTRNGVTVPGRVVDLKRERKEVTNRSGGSFSNQPRSKVWEEVVPVVAYRSPDGRTWQEAASVGSRVPVGEHHPGQLAGAEAGTGQSWSLASTYSVGQEVNVIHLPDDPATFRIAGHSGSRLGPILMMSIGGLFVVIGIVMVIFAL